MRYFSTDQIREVCIAARKAYDVWEGREQWEETNGDLSRTDCFELWRHTETGKVADGEQSLRHCISERHYLKLLAHFCEISGDGASALRALLRHGEEPRIRVFFKLQQQLAEKGLDEGYAAHIAKCKFKKLLGDCTEKQLWSLYFDVKKRPAKPVAKPEPKRVQAELGTLRVAGPRKKAAASTIAALEGALAEAVSDERYEDAAKLRDQIAAAKNPRLETAPF